MAAPSTSWRGLVALLLPVSCVRAADAPVTPEPVALETTEEDDGSFDYVSTDRNADDDDDDDDDAQAGPTYDGDPAVTTFARAHEVADAAVADRLDPKQRWESSPVLPTAWPRAERHVVVYYYPLAANPDSLSHFQLFSAAYAVTVSLDDGEASVAELKKKKLGTIEDARASRLEREELELAETTLMHYLLSGDSGEGENAFWGYLKFFHEHPKLGADIRRRHPAFARWLDKRNPGRH